MATDLASQIDLVIFDFDGVLTDNRVLVMENGLEAVVCNRSDGLAFDMLRAAGLPAMIMSTERNAVVEVRAAKLKVPVMQAVQSKSQALAEYCVTNTINPGRIAFVGNDLNDLEVMRLVGWPVAVADAHPAVKSLARIVLQTCGGAGAAREFVEQVLGITYTEIRNQAGAKK